MQSSWIDAAGRHERRGDLPDRRHAHARARSTTRRPSTRTPASGSSTSLANDRAQAGTVPFVVTDVTDPSKGDVVIAPDGSAVLYTPHCGRHRQRHLRLHGLRRRHGHDRAPSPITAVNDAPGRRRRDADRSTEDAAATAVPVLTGDTDIDSSTLITITGQRPTGPRARSRSPAAARGLDLQAEPQRHGLGHASPTRCPDRRARPTRPPVTSHDHPGQRPAGRR